MRTELLVKQINQVICAKYVLAHLKLESYGSAIEDASKALELDKTFVKVHREQRASC